MFTFILIVCLDNHSPNPLQIYVKKNKSATRIKKENTNCHELKANCHK